MSPCVPDVIRHPPRYSVRPFASLAGTSPTEITKAVDNALKGLPEDAKGALVVGADMARARIEIWARIAPGWTFVAHADKLWEGPMSAGVSVVGSW